MATTSCSEIEAREMPEMRPVRGGRRLASIAAGDLTLEHSLDDGPDLGERHGLGEGDGAGGLQEPGRLGAENVSGEEDEPVTPLRPPPLDLAVETGSVQPRHPHVANDHVVRARREAVERDAPVTSDVDLVAVDGEELGQYLGDLCLVLDEKDPTRVEPRRRHWRGPGPRDDGPRA